MGLWGRREAYTVEQVSDLLLNNAINTKRLGEPMKHTILVAQHQAFTVDKKF